MECMTVYERENEANHVGLITFENNVVYSQPVNRLCRPGFEPKTFCSEVRPKPLDQRAPYDRDVCVRGTVF